MAKREFRPRFSSVARPDILLESEDVHVFVPKELIFSAPCPFDGLPCDALSICFADQLDSVGRYVTFSRCARFGVR
jgi:hypothetical protein